MFPVCQEENEEAGTTHCLSFCSALHEGAVNTHMPKPKKPRRRKDTLLYMSALQMMEGLSLIEEQGEYLYKSHLAITALAVLCIGVRQGWRCVSCLALSLESSYRRWLGVDRCGTRHTHGIAGSLAGNNPIHALAVRLLRRQPEPELLAHHGGQEGAHRVRLPAGGARDGGDGGAARSAQQCWMQTAPCAQVCAWTCDVCARARDTGRRARAAYHRRRSSNANGLRGQNSAGSRKSTRLFKGIIC